MKFLQSQITWGQGKSAQDSVGAWWGTACVCEANSVSKEFHIQISDVHPWERVNIVGWLVLFDLAATGICLDFSLYTSYLYPDALS